MRRYEDGLLRKISSSATGACYKDPRKDIDEYACWRKSAGVLAVAVTPCLQIAHAAPMHTSESLAQVSIVAGTLVLVELGLRA